MTAEQRAFVEKLLEDWGNDLLFIQDERGRGDDRPEVEAEVAARRAEFERLFPKRRTPQLGEFVEIPRAGICQVTGVRVSPEKITVFAKRPSPGLGHRQGTWEEFVEQYRQISEVPVIVEKPDYWEEPTHE